MTLPKGWAEATLAQVAQPGGVKVNPQGSPDLPYIGLEDVEPETGRITGRQNATKFKSAAVRFSAGDLIYGRLRPYLNKVAVPDFAGVASAEFIVLPSSDAADASFLQHVLRSPRFVAFTAMVSTGDRPRVAAEQIGDFDLSLPPLPEQRRIVAKIDSLTARSRRARADLERALSALDRLRAESLRGMFVGSNVTVPLRAIIADSGVGLVRSKEQQSAVGTPYVRMQHFDAEGA